MSVKKVPAKFVTSDGKEWDAEVEAKRHQSMLDARNQYDHASQVLGMKIAESTKTADGHFFEFGLFRDYYYISSGWADMPSIFKVSFLGRNITWKDYDDEFCLTQIEADSKEHSYRISNLYREKLNAERALLAAQEKWLKDRTEEVEKLRAVIQGKEGKR